MLSFHFSDQSWIVWRHFQAIITERRRNSLSKSYLLSHWSLGIGGSNSFLFWLKTNSLKNYLFYLFNHGTSTDRTAFSFSTKKPILYRFSHLENEPWPLLVSHSFHRCWPQDQNRLSTSVLISPLHKIRLVHDTIISTTEYCFWIQYCHMTNIVI